MPKTEFVLFDIDTTLLPTYGKQEGEGFNFHYQAHGYHPLLCYDELTGNLLRAYKAELMLAEKTIENKRLYLYHFCRYMKVNGLGYEDISIVPGRGA